MSIATINSTDTKAYSANIQNALTELIEHVREDIAKVPERKFQALLETTAETLTGLRNAYEHYDEAGEPAWSK